MLCLATATVAATKATTKATTETLAMLELAAKALRLRFFSFWAKYFGCEIRNTRRNILEKVADEPQPNTLRPEPNLKVLKSSISDSCN